MVKKTSKSAIQPEGQFNLELWLNELGRQHPQDLTLIKAACSFVETHGGNISTPLKYSCQYMGLVMAEILFHLGLDAETLAAAMVYETFRYNNLSEKEITDSLGVNVAHLVLGVHKMHSMHHDVHVQQTENLRRLLLAVVEDVRVVLIKLAEYTAEMRAAVNLNESERQYYAKGAQEIYAPLANRLGIGQIKWELEDLAFRFLEPIAYKQLAKQLDERRIDRETFINETIDHLKKALNEQEIKAVVTGRAKHLYSIWKKMQRKGVTYHQIYDIHALRIIVENEKDCYAALGVVHGLWHHIPKEFDDYIANPKNNGYRSLHTAVIGPEGKTIEIQIRTNSMHDQSELGVAAHWRYKEGVIQDERYETKLASLRQVLRWQEDWLNDTALDEALKSEVFHDRVYVLTPKGQIIDLPVGATVLDFAYHIHSEIGHRCRGAKVNGRIVPLNSTLKSGDHVEIITTKIGGPSRDWLIPQFGYITTARARSKAYQWFKHQDREKNITEGRDALEKELQRLGLDNINFEALAHQLKINKVEDMLAGIGVGEVRVTQLLSAIQAVAEPLKQREAPLKSMVRPPTSKPERTGEIIVAGVGNLMSHIARCCKPVPGDEIIGYIAAGRGVSVHRRDCINIIQAKERQQSRLIQVEWGRETRNLYSVDIIVLAHDRQGLLRDISSVLASEHINVVAVQSSVNKEKNLSQIKLSLEITGIETLGKVFRRLQELPNIIDVKRSVG